MIHNATNKLIYTKLIREILVKIIGDLNSLIKLLTKSKLLSFLKEEVVDD